MNIAIVEDNKVEAAILRGYIERFAAEDQTEDFRIFEFPDGILFLSNYTAIYDVVFMDIEMPEINGMVVAKKLREMDADVPLVFVTNMSQYAIYGYEVEAVDYILKPVGYYRLSSLLKKIMRKKRERLADATYVVKTPYGIRQLAVSRISYVEVVNHKLLFHADETVESWGTLHEAERMLPSTLFVRCNNCYIVNLAYVKAVRGNEISVGNDVITISRGRKKELMDRLNDYFRNK